LWFAGVVTLGATELLHASPAEPVEVRRVAIMKLGAAILLPLLILCSLPALFRPLKSGLAAMPVWGLVALNSTRILGVSFLVLHAQDRLPAAFALVAGWGDIAIGLAAIPVAYLAYSNLAGNRGLILGWNILGLLDLIAAVGLGITASLAAHPSIGTGTGTMTLLPWLLIPGFLVPLLATTHIAIFYKFATRQVPEAAYGR
jgi:hypothetical protein